MSEAEVKLLESIAEGGYLAAKLAVAKAKENARLRDALEKIASSTSDNMWWQIEARQALDER